MHVTLPFTPDDHPMIDIHCHRIKAGQHLQILNVDTHQIIDNDHRQLPPCKELIDQLSQNVFLSIGLHPWFIDRQNIVAALQTLQSYRHHERLLALGECGLDKAINFDISDQSAVFIRHIEVAEEWQKPLIIHCVRAFNELIAIKKAVKPKQPWIIHGFNNNPALAKQLLKQDCYLSFGKALLQAQSNAGKILQSMPLDHLFLETDDASDLPIRAIYAAAARICNLSTDSLRQQIFSNFDRVFFND